MATNPIVDSVAETTSEQSQAQTAEKEAAAAAEETSSKVSLELDLDSIPEKFRKDPSQVFKSYSELESELGRARHNVGTYRDLANELSVLKRESDLAQTETAEETVITSDALLEDPQSTIASVVQRELEKQLNPLQDQLRQNEAEQELSRFVQDFPTFQEDVQTQEYKEFVMARPSRQQDAQSAAQGDLYAARRLLENFEDLKPAKKAAEETKETASMDSAPTGVSGAQVVATESTAAGGAVDGKKMWTRQEVLDTITNKPELYQSAQYQAEMMQAIKDGRYRA